MEEAPKKNSQILVEKVMSPETGILGAEHKRSSRKSALRPNLEDKNIHEQTLHRLKKSKEMLRLARARWESEDKYEAAVDACLDSLSDAKIEEFASELRRALQGSGDKQFQLYQEFGIDPLISDLEKHDYGVLADGRPRVIFQPINDPDRETAGETFGEQVFLYYPGTVAKAHPRKHELPMDGPRDIRLSIKNFLKFGSFGFFTQTILHELIHTTQFSEKGMLDENLAEAHAYSAVNFRYKGLAKSVFLLDILAGKAHPEYNIEGFISKLSEEDYRFLVAAFVHIRHMSRQRYTELLKNRKEFVRTQYEPEPHPSYHFSTDRLIEGLFIIDKLRTLDFSEREIGGILSSKQTWQGKQTWYDFQYRFLNLEAFINEETKKRGWSSGDLEDRVMLYRLGKQAEYKKTLAFARNFFFEYSRRHVGEDATPPQAASAGQL